MENELNIAAILKEKPEATKLWSPIFGNCKLSRLLDSGIRVFPIHNGVTSTVEKSFFKTGQYTLAGEVCLFPSKQMRDWHKFAWKKGDVLVNSRGLKILFDRWANDNYTSFYAKTINLVEDAFLDTNLHTLASEKEAKSFIKCIEEKLGGRLNLETLEIEKPKQEFKDGDVIIIMPHIGDKLIYLFKAEDDEKYYGHAFLDGNIAIVNEDSYCPKDFCTARPSTDEEKQQLFDALAKEGKRWNPDTKQFEDLPKKYEFKPFDKVLVRDYLKDKWMPNFFSCYDGTTSDYKYGCIAGNIDNVVFSRYCIPYNEETAKLIGTTNNVEG